MENILDNPAWNALVSGNKHLGGGTDKVKYFTPEVSPFVALHQNTAQNLHLLDAAIPFDSPIGLITTTQLPIPDSWTLLQRVDGLQMVYDSVTEKPQTSLPIRPLTSADVPDMIALTQLTRPGPFSTRTIEFGHYEGIVDEGKLIAMSGQRLNPFSYAEVSAVCTHPDHLGKGYARQLISNQLYRIQQSEGIPFLHVRSDNKRAIQLYEAMNFTVRTEIYFYFIKRK
ncbi:GNAT family N-acetyltransferase [Spirosoma aerolatum]|uniref:GNAT family N-acetyltransferase n=1 Tax=Spirosoma aerolatum TaxID=1211326 RepID=UPI0009AD78F5|nr:GNAT family N-acetyltransferase [Spirosoma aerolatum]